MTEQRDADDLWFRVASRRLREVPWLLVPAGLVVAAAGASIASVWVESPGVRLGTLGLWAWATLASIAAAAVLARRFHGHPPAPGDDASPIRVRWSADGFTSSPGPSDATVHALPDALRIVAGEWLGTDLAWIVAGGIAGAVGGAGWGVAAIPVLAWALGFPRTQRVALDLPWDDIARVVTDSAGRCILWRRDDPHAALALEASFPHRDRLVTVLADRLGERWSTGRTPSVHAAVSSGAAEDADDGCATVFVARARRRPAAAAASVLFAASAAYAAARVAGMAADFGLAVALGGFASLFALLSFVSGDAPDRRDAAGLRPSDDVDLPIPIRWTDRPGWPGPRDAEAHVLGGALRVVGYEWESMDVLALLAAMLAVSAASGCFGFAGVWMLARTLGFPRRRRVAVDVPWADVERADVAGTRVEIRTRLPEPWHLLTLGALYSARDRLTQALTSRLGARTFVARRIPPGSDVPSHEPTEEDLAAQTERLRRLRDA